MRTTWVVVADSFRASVYERVEDPNSRLGRLQPLSALVHPEARQKSAELEDAPLGRASKGGVGSTSFAPHTELKDKELERFAREIAQGLDKGVAGGHCDEVQLFAPPRMLGALRAALDAQTARHLSVSQAIDLTGCGANELAQRIDALQPQAGA